MATVGKNILDNLTTGMYSDSKVIYREYIQNACDQIDLAINEGILGKGEGAVDIYIDSQRRFISIKDNATGIKAEDFAENVGDIANSNKKRGKNKGFRGIGRLCGLAYCQTLKFTASYEGKPVKSVMTCDAKKMRAMLVEERKYTLDDIWDAIVSYTTESAAPEEHFFEVEMYGISKENTELLDSGKVRAYLSFVVPVPYKNTFVLRSQIYDYAGVVGYRMDEYCIRVNGCQIFKEYTTKLKESSGEKLKNYDEITGLEFKDFRDDNGRLIAWMWVGISRFEKQIPRVNQMRGLRLRSANIQIGNDNALAGLFKEHRGNYYFVGEVFAASPALIPNSQRNYFNENEARILFEDLLREYFFNVLHKLYHDANRIKNDYKRQEEYIEKAEEFRRKEAEDGFAGVEERTKMEFEVAKLQKSAREARRRLDRLNAADTASPMSEVVKNIERKYKSGKLKKKAESTVFQPGVYSGGDVPAAGGMTKLSKNERQMVTQILSIITDIAPREVAEQIIKKIKEEMKLLLYE